MRGSAGCRRHERPTPSARVKVKVKSGCGTCKIRKVKCDEGRPSCRRCVSTGRTCDGYGIWGGGGSGSGNSKGVGGHRASGLPSKNRPPAALAVLSIGAEEVQCFEWFQCRTATKIRGLFVLSFWESLLFQASASEPAILHAVLALGSIHRREVLCGSRAPVNNETPDEQEQFMLQHYIKAIGHLRPHFVANDLWSIRVALITCVVFVYLELLRGHFRTAQTHLQNGLKVLREIQTDGTEDDDEGICLLKPSCHAVINDWILEAFSRLHIQVVLFQQYYHPPSMYFHSVESARLDSVSVFLTINEAWQQLERLLYDISHLAKQNTQERTLGCSSSGPSSAQLRRQQELKDEVARWLDTYKASRSTVKGIPDEVGERFAYLLLSMHHTMATIMAETCLALDDESIFDSYTDLFMTLIDQSKMMRYSRPASETLIPELRVDMSHSVVDIGWMPPLYYTAIKCRDHRVRLEAVRLLESTSHREGLWDSTIAACIARKVMEIEESDFYRDIGMDLADDFDTFALSSTPEPGDMALPTLPMAHRIRQINVVLSDGPADSVFLFYEQQQSGRGWRSCSREYNLSSQRWSLDDEHNDKGNY